jgi:hypothetical protein
MWDQERKESTLFVQPSATNTGWRWLTSTHRVFPLLDGFEVGCEIRQTRREEILLEQKPGVSEGHFVKGSCQVTLGGQ